MKVKRTKEDICLLCKTQKATKKNSHLIPKFLTKKMLDPLNSGRRQGFKVDVENGSIINDKQCQDTCKDDFIFCSKCEDRFGKIETIMSKHLPHLGKYMKEKTNQDGKKLDEIELENLDPRIFHLFVYSLFWRLSISTDSFDLFKLTTNEEEELRKILDMYLKEQHKELMAYLEKTDEKNFTYLKVVTFTPEKIKDHSLHSIYVKEVNPNWYSLLVDNFNFNLIFSLPDEPNIEEASRELSLHPKGENIKIRLLNSNMWETMHLQRRKLCDDLRIKNTR